ncbi:NAD(P)-binding protein [Xylaria bambusicola]|uniref:NAD(P)-binding protein n=1 Tax=Xylaria bambusicola TaxID=326684 RepID=UPI002008C1CC|nr:NAD(P)-binding protein [Xylaria bambusicola]KAI0508250.1 NAD(P)-binding protein [Xylaria bambusicola]
MAGPRTNQKTVLVTGCTPGGIGHSLCLEYHRQGLHVIATARRPEVIADLAELGMSVVALDVTDAESIKKCHDEVAKINGGKLDILVNNAGRTHTHPALDISLPDVRATFETNVFAIMAMVQAFTDQLAAAKGLIINISSLSSITPYLFGSVYCASKAAVNAYSRTLRMELAPLGVRVMVSMTGTVKSNTASQGHRVLPENSVYQKIKHIFEWRLVFSQHNNTMDTLTFAKRLVADSLRPERPIWLRSLVGRPDWFWYGGMASIAWFGHSLGEWAVDAVCWYKFRMPEIMKLLADNVAQKKSK